jgi:hypothetical protein
MLLLASCGHISSDAQDPHGALDAGGGASDATSARGDGATAQRGTRHAA